MPTNEQRRQAAKRKLERQLANRAARAKRRRIYAVVGTVAVVLLAVAGIYWVASDDDETTPAAQPTDTSTPPAGNTTGGPCKYAETPSEPAAKEVGLPDDPDPTPNTGTVQVTVKTDQGDIPLTLDRAKAPCTVQNFAHLAQQKYYDGTSCHRMTASEGLKVLQCGDPKGDGSGGPGYTIKDEPPTDLQPSPDGQTSVYPRGTLAMAKTQAPDSGGSQFFMVYADSKLPPEYTVFGTIAEAGLAVLDKIAAGGIQPADPSAPPTDGAPKIPVMITEAVLAE